MTGARSGDRSRASRSGWALARRDRRAAAARREARHHRATGNASPVGATPCTLAMAATRRHGARCAATGKGRFGPEHGGHLTNRGRPARRAPCPGRIVGPAYPAPSAGQAVRPQTPDRADHVLGPSAARTGARSPRVGRRRAGAPGGTCSGHGRRGGQPALPDLPFLRGTDARLRIGGTDICNFRQIVRTAGSRRRPLGCALSRPAHALRDRPRRHPS